MSKINNLIKELCPNGVRYYKLSEIGNQYSGLSGKSKNDFENGNWKKSIEDARSKIASLKGWDGLFNEVDNIY